jgi:hypothetical protein
VTTLTTTEAFVAWMEDLYLSELVLLSCKPAPKAVAPRRAPARVTLELGLRDHEHEGARDRFFVWSLVATGVTRWVLEPSADHPTLESDAELTFPPTDDVAAPITLRLRAGAGAVLACTAIETSEAAPRFRKARPRAWQRNFTMWMSSVSETVDDVLCELGDEVTLMSYDDVPILAQRSWLLSGLDDRTPRAWRILRGDRHIASLSLVFRHQPGATSSLQRADATDDEWDILWSLPVRFDAERVMSRTLDTTGAAWARVDWRKGAKP